MKLLIYDSAVLFKTETRIKAYRQQMECLVNGEIIDNGVVDAWCEFLNSLESLRIENLMSRFFLPTFVVDKKLFGSEAKANESVTKFIMDVEKVNERVGKKDMLKKVDLAYMGNVMSKWDCGPEVEGKKQNTMLGCLRKRYAATLLLLECNLHMDSIRA
nr:C2 calcium-dependent membrane targeting [Tanacetum cinerariifolium]